MNQHVSGGFGITVSNRSAFLSNEVAQQAVTAAIGEMGGVPFSAVNAQYKASSQSQTRRLQGLQSGDVQVSYVIDVPSGKSALTVAQSLDSQSPQSIRSTIRESLNKARVDSLTVSSIVGINVNVGTTTMLPTTFKIPDEIIDSASMPVLGPIAVLVSLAAWHQLHAASSD